MIGIILYYIYGKKLVDKMYLVIKRYKKKIFIDERNK